MIDTDVRPDAVASVVLGHDHWGVPREIMGAVFRPSARVAVKACHASSKTFTAADCILVALLLGGDVLTTAPTWEQVETVLWGDVRVAVRGAKLPARAWGVVNRTEIVLPSGERAMGLSTNEGTRFQGWHARPGTFLLVIVDEATGVKPEIFEAIEGISAGGDVRILLLGNPTVPSGYFFDVFQGETGLWKLVTIDAFETPNLVGMTLEELLELPEGELDGGPRPYLVTRRWVRDRYWEWGVDHPEWQARVRGEFPQNADVSLVWRSWIDAASKRVVEYEPGMGVVAGIDVAGPGEDETVCCVRRGAALVGTEWWTGADPRGAVLGCLRRYVREGLSRVNVDSTGIGYYFAQYLRDELPPEVQVVDVNVGAGPSSAAMKEKFFNLRAELYWALAERFRDGEISGVTDRVMQAQLAGLQYVHTFQGRVMIEKKDDARKRGVKSPDRAEALMLCYAPEKVASAVVGLFGRVAKMAVGR